MVVFFLSVNVFSMSVWKPSGTRISEINRLQKEKSKLENAQNELDQAKVLLKAKVMRQTALFQEGRGTNNYRHVFCKQGFAVVREVAATPTL